MTPETLNRAQAPQLRSLTAPAFPAPREKLLRNGLPVYFVPFGTQPVCEVQLVLRGGQWAESFAAQTSLACKMLTEGTSNYTSVQLAQALDALGGFLSVSGGMQATTISLSLLSRNLAPGLQLMQEVLLNPIFPERPYHQLIERSLQQVRIQAQKTSYQAQEAFYEGLYGTAHPYGRIEDEAAIAAVTRAQAQAFWQDCIRPMDGFVVVSGQFDPGSTFLALEDTFGVLQRGAAVVAPEHSATAQQVGRRHVHMPGNVQSTLLLGHIGPDRHHPQHYPLRLLATVFGGYFGSRLMKNLREDKGYTYGIGAGFSAQAQGGTFSIRTDLDNTYLEPAIEAIRTELDRIRTEPVGADELERARNYLLGRIISGQETPFQVGDILKTLLLNGLTVQSFTDSFQQLQKTTAEDLLLLAREHLRPADLLIVSAGGTEVDSLVA